MKYMEFMMNEAKQKLVDEAQAEVNRLTQELSTASTKLQEAKSDSKIEPIEEADARFKKEQAELAEKATKKTSKK